MALKPSMEPLEKSNLTISRCISKKSSRLSDPIPPDVLIDILSRIPLKSIARFLCVSKFWKSIIIGPYFKELFMTKSLSHPKILFVFRMNNLRFFTSKQLQHPNPSLSLEASPHSTFSHTPRYAKYCPPVRGLICINSEGMLFVIYNLITRKIIPLPELKAGYCFVTSFFGYDPINKQFKVLCTTNGRYTKIPVEHYVLTLKTDEEQMVWRRIEFYKSVRPVLPSTHAICIDGVMYYIGEDNDSDEKCVHVVVCFDIRSEKFSFINLPEYLSIRCTRLINHKGQLCVTYSGCTIDGESTNSFRFFFLKDAEKHEWTNQIYILPQSCWEGVQGNKWYVVGVIDECEIVLSTRDVSRRPFYLLYYNLVKKIGRKVYIRGFEGHNIPTHIDCFLNYVEDVLLI